MYNASNINKTIISVTIKIGILVTLLKARIIKNILIQDPTCVLPEFQRLIKIKQMHSPKSYLTDLNYRTISFYCLSFKYDARHMCSVTCDIRFKGYRKKSPRQNPPD